MTDDVHDTFDDELTALLRSAAQDFEVPPEGEAGVLAAARSGATRRSDRTSEGTVHPAHRVRPAFRWAAAAVILVVAAGAFGLVSGTGTDSNASFTAVGGRIADQPTSGGAEADGAEEEDQLLRTLTDGDAAVVADEGADGAPAQVTPAIAPRIVKTAGLEIEVAKGAFDRAADRITTVVAGAGGFVADSKSAESAAAPSGTFTLRIPSERFESVLADMREIGTVLVSSSSGTDVTAQYTDLEARIRTATQARDRYQTLLTEAQNIGEVLAVQDRVNAAQTELEQLEGQRKLLADQADLATLTMSVREKLPEGAPDPALAPGERTGFSKAWHDAIDGFTGGFERILAGSGSFLVILLCLAALFLVARVIWKVGARRLI